MFKKLLASFSVLVLMFAFFSVPVYATEQKQVVKSVPFETSPIGVPVEDIIVDRIAIDDYGNIVQVYVFANNQYVQTRASRESLYNGDIYLRTGRADKIVSTKRQGFGPDTIECTPNSGGAVTFNCNGIEQAVDVGYTCQYLIKISSSDIYVSVRPNWYDGWYNLSVVRVTGS